MRHSLCCPASKARLAVFVVVYLLALTGVFIGLAYVIEATS